MSIFKVSVNKSAAGEILVNGLFVSGSQPLVVERVVLEELDGGGGTVGASIHRLALTIDAVPGSTLLVTKMPFGSNVHAARATAHYYEIDRTAKSPTFSF